MTIDDETSVYVGNLPYDATEDTIRSVFNLYGQIIAVKLINDRGVGGKYYGFVTYTNPRSAVNAISDMDGRTVNGRVIKVNEVKTRGGRSSFSHDNYRQNNNKDVELDRSRGRDRDRDRDRERDYGRVRDRSRDQNREFSRDRDHGKERGFDHSHDTDRTRDRFIDRDRGYDQDKDMDDIEREREKDHDQTARDHRSGNKYNDQTAKLTNGSDFSERHSREHPLGSSHEDPDQVAKQLVVSRHKIEELQKEIFHMEELVEERGDYVSKLQEKCQKLEDALASAKKLTSNRKKQLIKLHKCFQNIKEYREKLRSSEEELQFLVGSSMKELENQVGLDTEGLLAYDNRLAD